MGPGAEACWNWRRGAHGFVQLALDMQSGEEVACKFIERGQSLDSKNLLRCAPRPVARSPRALPEALTAWPAAGPACLPGLSP